MPLNITDAEAKRLAELNAKRMACIWKVELGYVGAVRVPFLVIPDHDGIRFGNESHNEQELAAAAVNALPGLLADREAMLRRISRLEAVIYATVLDARGRSGGSVYMIHKEQFFALRAAHRGEEPT